MSDREREWDWETFLRYPRETLELLSGQPVTTTPSVTIPYREPSPDDFIPLHGPHHTTFGMAPYLGDSGDESDPVPAPPYQEGEA